MICPARQRMFGLFRRGHLFQAVDAWQFGPLDWHLHSVLFTCVYCRAQVREIVEEHEAVSRGLPVTRGGEDHERR